MVSFHPSRRQRLVLASAIATALVATIAIALLMGNPASASDDCTSSPGNIDLVSYNHARGLAGADHANMTAAGLASGDRLAANFRVGGDCAEAPVSLASYKVPASGSGFVLFDSANGTFAGGNVIHSLGPVAMPDCRFAVFLVVGDVLPTITPQTNYASDPTRIIEYATGGSRVCTGMGGTDGNGSGSGNGGNGTAYDGACPIVNAEADGDGRVKLQWTMVHGATGYVVKRMVDGEPETARITVTLAKMGPGTTTMTDTSTTHGVTYAYKVVPVGVDGAEGCPAVIVTAIPVFGGAWTVALAALGGVAALAILGRRRR